MKEKKGIIPIDNNKRHTPEYRENEWSDLFDSDIIMAFIEQITKEFEENAKKVDYEGLDKFNKSVNSVLEEQKTDPEYFQKLVNAQFNGLIVKRK